MVMEFSLSFVRDRLVRIYRPSRIYGSRAIAFEFVMGNRPEEISLEQTVRSLEQPIMAPGNASLLVSSLYENSHRLKSFMSRDLRDDDESCR